MSDAKVHRFTILCRALAEYPDTTSATVKLATDSEPDETKLAECREAIAAMYRGMLEEEPARVAVVVLPWVESDTQDDPPPYRGDEDEEWD